MAIIRIGIIDHASYCVTAVRNFLRAALSSISTFFRASFYRLHAKLHPWEYPWTTEQRQARKTQFIQSISREAVCRLASKFNDGRPCEIFNTSNGSFNACFFVEFPHDGTKWVVRIPIEPVLDDGWAKVDSEAATMRYVKNHTRIPLPRVCAFGKSKGLISGSSRQQAFLIVEYIPGNQLDIDAFLKDSRERRNHLYSQLIDIFAELRSLEFPAAGTLRSDPRGGPDPILGPYHSQQIAEARAQGYQGKLISRPLDSLRDYVDCQFEYIRATFGRPCDYQALDGAREEIYAIEQVQREANRLMGPDGPWTDGPFVLSHRDLRWPNIIVDESLNITAVIDWEWTASVPRQLVLPPDWITGRSREWIIGYTGHLYRDEYAHFYQILKSKAETSEVYKQLAESWEPSLLERSEFSVGEILHYHHEVDNMFYGGLFYQINDSTVKEALPAFFEDAENYKFARQARNQVTRSERYTRYLQDNNLIDPSASEVIKTGEAK